MYLSSRGHHRWRITDAFWENNKIVINGKKGWILTVFRDFKDWGRGCVDTEFVYNGHFGRPVLEG